MHICVCMFISFHEPAAGQTCGITYIGMAIYIGFRRENVIQGQTWVTPFSSQPKSGWIIRHFLAFIGTRHCLCIYVVVVFDTQCAFILFGFGCMLSAKTITHVIELAVCGTNQGFERKKLPLFRVRPELEFHVKKYSCRR